MNPVDKANNVADSKVATIETIDTRLSGITFPYYSRKEVIIRRRERGDVLPGLDPDEFKANIGSSGIGSTPYKGVDKDEERRFLPGVIGYDEKSPDWERQAREYWCNIHREVPPTGKDGRGGLKIEAGLYYDSKEKYLRDLDAIPNKDGIIVNPAGDPISIVDYLLYRYCLVYPELANDVSMVNNSPKIRFYMFTKEKEIADQKVVVAGKRKAFETYSKNIGDDSWVNFMLRSLVAGDKDARVQVKDVTAMKRDEKDIMLYSYMEKDPSKFVGLGTDKNLEMRSFIEMAVAVGKLHRVPNTMTILNEGSTLGNTTEEVIATLNNPAMADVLRALKAQVNIAP